MHATLEAARQWPSAVVRTLGLAVFVLLLVLLSSRFAAYLVYALASIAYPFELDYGEGIVWQQALLIPGDRMYGDINRYPFIVFHYPPVYHLAVRSIALLGVDFLAAGRALSVVATLAIAVLVVLLTFRAAPGKAERWISVFGGAIGALVLFTYSPVVFWSRFMRVDMLAVALSFFGIYLATLSVARPALLHGAALAFVASIYTKQTSVAAPLAAFAVLLLARPRQAIRSIGYGLLMGVVVLAYLTLETDGGFLRHIVRYNVNSFSVLRAAYAIKTMVLGHWIYLSLVSGSLLVAWGRNIVCDGRRGWWSVLTKHLGASDGFMVVAIFTIYFVVSSAMLVTVGKSGASVNYYIEWMCTWSVILGIAVASTLRVVWQSRPPAASQLLRGIAAIGLVVALAAQGRLWPGQFSAPRSARPSQQQATLLSKIREAQKPVLSEDMVLLMRAGKEVPMEPAIFSELARMGIWDERRVVELIRGRFFEFVVISSSLPSPRFTPSMRAAIETAYPTLVKYAGYHVFLPRD